MNSKQQKLKKQLNKIMVGDSLELTSSLPPRSIDLIISDGPYGRAIHEWDQVGSIQEYNLELIKLSSRLLKAKGSLYLFGKHDCIDFIDYRPYLNLKNRIVWHQPSRMGQGRLSYTNNYDVICYFVKGKHPIFNLDDIKVAQIESRSRSSQAASGSGSGSGSGDSKAEKECVKSKNPGDVWSDIKPLTPKSKELVSRDSHTIQKPENLIERMVLASSNPQDVVLDLFSGTGTVSAVCLKHNRNFIAFEMNSSLVTESRERLHARSKTKTRG